MAECLRKANGLWNVRLVSLSTPPSSVTSGQGNAVWVAATKSCRLRSSSDWPGGNHPARPASSRSAAQPLGRLDLVAATLHDDLPDSDWEMLVTERLAAVRPSACGESVSVRRGTSYIRSAIYAACLLQSSEDRR